MRERPKKAIAKHDGDMYSNYAACVAEQPVQAGIVSFPDLSIAEPTAYTPFFDPSSTSYFPAPVEVERASIASRSEAVTSDSATPTEETPLMTSTAPPPSNVAEQSKEISTWEFYVLLIRQRRTLAAMFCSLTFAIMVSSFDATIPLHVQEVFGWGSFASGMLFVALQAPGAVCGPLCGWLRDR